MGGGLGAFQSPSHNLRFDDDWECERLDGIDLIEEWNQKKTAEEKTHAFIKDKSGLMEVDDSTEYLLGMCKDDYMKPDLSMYISIHCVKYENRNYYWKKLIKTYSNEI